MHTQNSKKIALLGFAHAHANAYLDVWRQQPQLGVLPVAGWDHDPDRAAAATEKHGLENAASVAEILDRADIDAVLIAAETVRHADLTCAAAAAGKAIILQKPLALTLAEADRIVAAVERHRVPFTLAWQMRVDPHNLKIRELLADGHFGKIYMVRRRHCLSVQKWPGFEKSWHVDPAANRDIFADDAAHPADFLLWLLGMPQSVMAELGTLGNPAIPNDNAIAIFRYANGTFAEISTTFVASAGENVCEVVCEHGTIIANYGDQVSCLNPWPPGAIQLKWFHTADNQWTISDLPDITIQGTRISGLAGPLARFLHGQQPPLATAAEGHQALRMILACYESATTGRRVTFNNPST
ncbi:MAG: Gfo/Idh/MocA family oxidoreductase [Lentisphaerae bacterium]|jgi:predicted dehydrogenase|nr:Gfo/Idh/MocA family oxidoreductase [Lentisphaerota bacterium]